MTPRVEVFYSASGAVREVKISGRKARRLPDNSCRVAFLTDKYALKVFCPKVSENDGNLAPGPANPKSQNRTEFRVWKRVKKTKDRKFFAPVIAAAKDFSWLLMKRINGTKRDYRFSYGYHDDKHSKKVDSLMRKRRLGDTGQVIISKGVPVIYDYGYRE